MKNFLILGVLIILTGLVNATQVCEVYDDFSVGTLDADKWVEASATLDEHFVEEGAYHTAQLSASDRVIILELKNRTFLPGDIIEYDVDYINGFGNRVHRIKLDDSKYSLFGFWNTILDGGVGNDFGTYHVKITFTEEGVTDEITLPNGSVVFTRPNGKLPSPGLEHTFGIITRTGHNGVVHMDYDNVIICTEEPEPLESTLEERLEELREGVEELENRTSLLESLVDKIIEFIRNLPRGLSKRY